MAAAKRVCALAALLLLGFAAFASAQGVGNGQDNLADLFIPAHGASTNPIADLAATCGAVKAVIDRDWCASQLTCFADALARTRATSGNVTATVSVAVSTVPGIGLGFQASGFVLATSQGGPGTSRGIIWIPEDGFEAMAYAPLASLISRIGHYFLILDNTTGLSYEQLMGRVNAAYNTRSNLRWAIGGHGVGGSNAARIAAVDTRFRGLALFGADLPDGVDLRNSGISVGVVYGLFDTVVTPDRVRSWVPTRIPLDAFVGAVNAAHADFAYSTCLGNANAQGVSGFTELHFLQPELPVFSMPASSNEMDKVVVNPVNPIVQQSAGVVPRIGRWCRAEDTQVYDAATMTWSSVDSEGRPLVNYLYAAAAGDDRQLALEARVGRNHYASVVAFLNEKRVRSTFVCEPFVEEALGVEYFISANPATYVVQTSAAATTAVQGTTTPVFAAGTVSVLTNIMGTLGFRSATQRALSFTNNAFLSPINATAPNGPSKVYPATAFGPVEYYFLDLPRSVDNPLPIRVHVWRPKRGETGTPKGGLVYLTGGSVDALGYAPLMFEIAARGYVVVSPTVALRAAILGPNVDLPNIAMRHADFSDVASNKWAIAGHSLGGFGAAQYTWTSYNRTSSGYLQPQVLIMHAGSIIPTISFRLLVANVPVYQIYGTLDDVGAGGFDRYRTSILPFTKTASTTFVVIPGANHYQVGDYGYQDPDSIATISQESQQTQFAERTVAAMVAAGLA